MTKKIFIFIDKIRSGKTTKLFKWLNRQKNVGGILQPVIEGKRFFYSISNRMIIQLELSEEEIKFVKKQSIIKIGSYYFLKESFLKAQKILLEDFKRNKGWLVIDEIGPLELNGEGLHQAVLKIIQEIKFYNGKVLLVIRDSILENVIRHFNLKNQYELFNFS